MATGEYLTWPELLDKALVVLSCQHIAYYSIKCHASDTEHYKPHDKVKPFVTHDTTNAHDVSKCLFSFLYISFYFLFLFLGLGHITSFFDSKCKSK